MGAGGGGVEEEIKMGEERKRERVCECVCARVLGIDKLLVKGLNIYKVLHFLLKEKSFGV